MKKTSYEKISIRPDKNEIVLFFHIDDQSNRHSKMREFCGMCRDGEAICDVLIFYTQKDDSNKNGNMDLICFVESKGGDVVKACKQIKNTYEHLKPEFEKNNYCKSIEYVVYINTTGASSQDVKRAKRELYRLFPKKLCEIKEKGNVGQHLQQCFKEINKN